MTAGEILASCLTLDLRLRADGAKIELVNRFGSPVAMLSGKAEECWRPLLGQVEGLRVLALIERRLEDDREECYRKLLKTEQWEVPVVEVVYRQVPRQESKRTQ